jgi:membrane associated rhomboid family serine protease
MNTFRPRPFADIPPVLKNLLIINILMFLATVVLQRTMNIDLDRMLGLYYFKSDYFRPYQIVTHMFMHGGLMHIFFNMFMLWMFGRILEQVWGGKRFLFYYLFTGLGAAALHMLAMHIELTPLIKDAAAFSNTPSVDVFDQFVKEHVRNPSSSLIEFMRAWVANPGNETYVQQAIQVVNQVVNQHLNIPTVGASGAIYGADLFPFLPDQGQIHGHRHGSH